MTNRDNMHNQYVGFLVYNAQRSIHKCLEESLKEYKITPGQWNVLNQLDSFGPLSQKMLALRTQKEQATITRYLDTLERRGLIIREMDTHDRRANLISVTEEARALIEASKSAVDEAAACLVDGIPHEDTKIFLDVLGKIKNNAERYPPA